MGCLPHGGSLRLELESLPRVETFSRRVMQKGEEPTLGAARGCNTGFEPRLSFLFPPPATRILASRTATKL